MSVTNREVGARHCAICGRSFRADLVTAFVEPLVHHSDAFAHRQCLEIFHRLHGSGNCPCKLPPRQFTRQVQAIVAAKEESRRRCENRGCATALLAIAASLTGYLWTKIMP